MLPDGSNRRKMTYLDPRNFFSMANSAKTQLRLLQTKVKLKSVMEIGGFFSIFLAFTDLKITLLYCQTCIVIHEWKGFDVSYHFFGGVSCVLCI